MSKKLLLLFLFAMACIIAGYLVERNLIGPASSSDVSSQPESSTNFAPQTMPIQRTQQLPAQQETTSPAATVDQKIQIDVPFVVQAPFGSWKDPIFQNACEEDSIIMSMGWVHSLASISAQEAQTQIKAVVAFENKTFGYNANTNLQDMQIIFQKYFNYQKIIIKENISLSDIKNELLSGNVVLVPAFGQALGNPNYTPPGPIEHMLVVIGYDPVKKEFITNDPGTKNGANYHYSENVLFDSIWEYPSGSAASSAPTNTLKKGMLVVSKS